MIYVLLIDPVLLSHRVKAGKCVFRGLAVFSISPRTFNFFIFFFCYFTFFFIKIPSSVFTQFAERETAAVGGNDPASPGAGRGAFDRGRGECCGGGQAAYGGEAGKRPRAGGPIFPPFWFGASRSVRLLRGTMVEGAYGIHKNLYI